MARMKFLCDAERCIVAVLRETRILGRHVRQRPVQFDVMKPPPQCARHPVGGPHLVADQIDDLGALQRQASSPKPLTVGKARMRANPDAVLQRHLHRARHYIRVARMTAAGHIGRGDHLHQGRVIAHGPRAIPLAQIGVQIDGLPHGVSLSTWPEMTPSTN